MVLCGYPHNHPGVQTGHTPANPTPSISDRNPYPSRPETRHTPGSPPRLYLQPCKQHRHLCGACTASHAINHMSLYEPRGPHTPPRPHIRPPLPTLTTQPHVEPRSPLNRPLSAPVPTPDAHPGPSTEASQSVVSALSRVVRHPSHRHAGPPNISDSTRRCNAVPHPGHRRNRATTAALPSPGRGPRRPRPSP